MNDNEQSQHWDDLARQLGLEPESEPPAAAAPAEAGETKTSGFSAAPAPVEEKPEREDWEAAPVAERFEEVVEKSIEEPLPEAYPPPREERRGRRSGGGRGRRDDSAPRRGRRGGRSRSYQRDTETPPRQEEVQPPGDEGTGSDTGSRPSESREEGGHRRRRAAPERLETSEELPEADVERGDEELRNDLVEPPPAAEEEDDEEVDTLSDWNVPSWNELIASLYRPER